MLSYSHTSRSVALKASHKQVNRLHCWIKVFPIKIYARSRSPQDSSQRWQVIPSHYQLRVCGCMPFATSLARKKYIEIYTAGRRRLFSTVGRITWSRKILIILKPPLKNCYCKQYATNMNISCTHHRVIVKNLRCFIGFLQQFHNTGIILAFVWRGRGPQTQVLSIVLEYIPSPIPYFLNRFFTK